MKFNILLLFFYLAFVTVTPVRAENSLPLFERVKNKMLNLLGREKIHQTDFSIPPIPEISKSATDSNVYDKNGPIFTQGSSFSSLSEKEKNSFNYSYLQELYQNAKRIELSDENAQIYLNNLSQGGSREAVYRALVSNESWATLESREEEISQELIDFLNEFSPKFLGVTYKKESLQKANMAMIKRIIVDRALDVLQEFTKKPEDLYRWYAVLSVYLANKIQFNENSIRNSSEFTIHERWVRDVPWDHIQSEVIIKLLFSLNAFVKES